jgi:hypothetical protein
MDENDIEEYLNVSNIMYGSDNYAIISEIGLCSGYDKKVMGSFNGNNAEYDESIATQIVNFIPAAFFASYNQTSWNTLISVGSTENLLDVT